MTLPANKYVCSLALSLVLTTCCFLLVLWVSSIATGRAKAWEPPGAEGAPDSSLPTPSVLPERTSGPEGLHRPRTAPEKIPPPGTRISRNPGIQEFREAADEARSGPGGDSADARDGGASKPEETTGEETTGDLTIGGRILDAEGGALQGIEVVARPYRQTPSPAGSKPAGLTRSETDGAYTIAGLGYGEYSISTTATDRYPPSNRVVRAGETAADLVLHPFEEIDVTGIVVDGRGVPLAGVEVTTEDQGRRRALTGQDGSFSIGLPANAERPIQTIRFAKEGYRERLLRWTAGEAAKDPGLRKVVLEEVGETTSVRGLLRTTEGETIGGEKITLYSEEFNTSYEAVSGPDGRFHIDGVQEGSHYRLRIYPDGNYRDHQEDLLIEKNGPPLSIVLEPMTVGTLEAVAVDPGGTPIPGFTLWVQSGKAGKKGVQVATGPDGTFRLDSVPEGPLIVETRSWPRLSIRGLEMPAEGIAEAVMVLDWGDRELSGRVLDGAGRPIPGAGVQLTWSRRDGRLTSTSQRTTQADESGAYRFSRLGAGLHRLSATSPDRPEVSRTIEVEAGSRRADLVLTN